MQDKFIINVCLTGMMPRKRMNPHVPMTAAEIARDVEECLALGASIFHLHARTEDEEPDWRTESYQTIVRAIRRLSPDAILCVSTSGRNVSDLERRTACLATDPAPDMASLTLGSVNFLRDATLNAPASIAALIGRMREKNVRPELEIFDIGMARSAARWLEDGTLPSPAYANIMLGNVASADASLLDLAALLQPLPKSLVRCVAGIGKTQLAANTLGILYADGVRVGLEDNLYFDDTKRLATNAMLVERVVALGALLGKTPSPIPETRRRLGLTV